MDVLSIPSCPCTSVLGQDEIDFGIVYQKFKVNLNIRNESYFELQLN